MPVGPTSLIGREEDVAAAKQRLLSDRVRLLTCVGPPGIGKTCLALEVAAGIAAEFRDGAFFIDLTTLTAAPLVMQSIARAFALPDTTLERTTPRLLRYLQERHALLILDNFEHVIDAAKDISELLGACGDLQIIATSREPLHLRWEQQFAVMPLGLPDLTRQHSAEGLMRYSAVRLFVERSRTIRRDFVLTEDNARTVAEICVRLDGIPLAIELAAGKVNVLQPHAILERLQQRLALLTTGPRDAPTRHQTLRDAIAWSYNLLTLREQILFRRMAVFVGGSGLQAIRTVCNGDGDLGADVLDGISALADKHLVRNLADGGEEPRFGMLESLREFGLEQLMARSEWSDIQRVHAGCFLELAARAEPGLAGHLRVWLDRLEPDRGNLRAAIEWFLANGEAENALRLAGSASRVWGSQGYFREIRELLQRSLHAAGQEPSMTRWKVLRASAQWAYMQGDLQSGAPLAAASLRLARILGENEAIAYSLLTSGWIAEYAGNLDEAITHLEEGLGLSRTLANQTLVCTTLCALANPVRLRGDLRRATALLHEGLSLALTVNDTSQASVALCQLGMMALDGGKHKQAESCLRDALTYARQGNFQFIITWVIEEMAKASRARGDLVRTATLLGAAGNFRDILAIPAMGAFRARLDQTLAAARTALGEEAFGRACAHGQAMSLTQVIDYALQPAGRRAARSEQPKAPAGAKPSLMLSGREQEVATLVAEGHTNRTIGTTLGIAEKTVGAHVQNIMNKLGFHSRSQIAAWTTAHGSN